MEGRDLPGFYYDWEKKKYFKIQANHVAPEGAKYSKSSVKKEKEITKKRKRTAAEQQKRRLETVTRSRILGSSLAAGTALTRELGYTRGHVAQAAAIVSQFDRKEVMDAGECESCGRKGIVYDFEYDYATNALVWGVGSDTGSRLQYVCPDRHTSTELAAFHSEISSIVITNSRTLIATSLTNAAPGNVFCMSMDTFFPSDRTTFEYSYYEAPTHSTVGNVETTLWASAANPAGANDMVAISAGDFIQVVDAKADHLGRHRTSSTAKAVSWLSPNVVIGGTVDGDIFLWDTRTWGSSQRFRNSSGINAISATGDEHSIVAGGFHSMALYDVRMPVSTPTAKPTSGKRHKGYRQPSPALWSWDIPSSYPTGAVAVWPSTQTLAVRDDANNVQLFSLLSRKHLGTRSPPVEDGDTPYIRRLRFIEDSVEGKTSLLGCSWGKVFAWDWGGDDDDDEGEVLPDRTGEVAAKKRDGGGGDERDKAREKGRGGQKMNRTTRRYA